MQVTAIARLGHSLAERESEKMYCKLALVLIIGTVLAHKGLTSPIQR